jgi:hypothetical protein
VNAVIVVVFSSLATLLMLSIVNILDPMGFFLVPGVESREICDGGRIGHSFAAAVLSQVPEHHVEHHQPAGFMIEQRLLTPQVTENPKI